MSPVQKFFVIFFSALLFSCTTDAGLPEYLKEIENLTVYAENEPPKFQIELQELARIDDSGEVILGRISGIHTDDDGRIFISDDVEKRINVYTPDGNFIKSLGRKGQGPGEFEFIHNLSVDENFVYAMDFSKNLINAYSLNTLEFSSTIPMANDIQSIDLLEGYFPSDFIVLASGDMLITYIKSIGQRTDEDHNRVDLLFRVDRDGQIQPEPTLHIETGDALVLRTGNSISVFGAPFLVTASAALSPDQKIVVNRTDKFLFKQYDESGNYERAFYHPYSPKSLTRERALSEYENENYRRAVRNSELPNTWPVVEKFLIDDAGRFWVATIIDDEDNLEWWVLDSKGELLAREILPKSQMVELVKNEYLYMREEDEMGLVEVVKYQLTLTQLN
jgi:hypothetical protein